MFLPTPTWAARAVSGFAMDRLAEVDYTVANKVSEDVARTVHWAYDHNAPVVAICAVRALQTFDDIGSMLISLVVWLIAHTG